MSIEGSNIVAAILALEEYRYSGGDGGINNVDFAINDATQFKGVLLSTFQATEENIVEWHNERLVKVTIENDLPYLIRNLTEENVFILYYAGHGFFHNGYNRITAWDTHPDSLEETTCCLNEVLLKPLTKSRCKRYMIFMDCCSKDLREAIKGRSVISNLSQKEFKEFVDLNTFGAFFFSCSPGEKAYPSNILKHGIWTYHLVEALKGADQQAMDSHNIITDISLRDYLRAIVPSFIRKNMTLTDTQTPYAIIAAANSFEICSFDVDAPGGLPALRIVNSEYCLRNVETISIERLPGFSKKKKHFVPDRYSSRASAFVQSLLSENIQEELKEVYNDAKQILGLKRRDIEKSYHDGGGAVETEYFRYHVDTFQDDEDPSDAIIIRELTIRVASKLLPDNFDDIFSCVFDEIVFEVKRCGSFDEIVDQFENLAEKNGGEVYEDEDEDIIAYTAKGFNVKFCPSKREMVIKPEKVGGCVELINFANKAALSIGSSLKSLE